jgi:hypothetical protein
MKKSVTAHAGRFTAKRAGRIVLAAVPVGIIATVLLGGVAQGAVPVSFAISGSQFKISASQLAGTGFSQYAGVAKDSKGGEHQVAIANIQNATLTNMCQSVVSETPLGKVGVMITAGGGDKPAEATGLQIGMTDLKGDAKFTSGSVSTPRRSTPPRKAHRATSPRTLTASRSRVFSRSPGRPRQPCSP